MRGTLRFLGLRGGQGIVVLLLVALIVFVLARLTGSPVDVLLPPEHTDAQREQLEEALGLDAPAYQQFGLFVRDLLLLDMGDSIKEKRPVTQILGERIPATMELAGAALLMSVVASVLLGVLSATQRGRWPDHVARLFALIGQAAPSFSVGIVLIWLFAVQWRLLPTSGRGGFDHLILPAIALGLAPVAALTRLLRSSMLEVLGSEFILFARAKGLSSVGVIWKHALKNAILVPLHYFGIVAGTMLTGTVVIESIFAWPGLGSLMIDSVRARDYPVVQSTAVLFAVIFVTLQILADLVILWVDPRVQHSESST